MAFAVMPPIVSKYFEVTDPSPDDPHTRLVRHGNGIVMLYLSSSHPALAAGVTAVAFDKRRVDQVQEGAMTGKRKRGAILLQEDTVVCRVTDTAGTVHVVRAVCRGRLLELNVELMANPALVAELDTGLGWLAIIQP